ncbi:MAG: DUF350 domain-containing protein [Dehalococcoidia bacterium]|jgi:hypothetical protein|nr:DUF350 domain-containing protein [Dehalococcoidia bacterium]
MSEIGLAVPFYITMLLWLAKTVILAFICGLLAWLGIRALDAVTPDIPARQRIGESPLAIGLFIGGFFILAGLVVDGAATAPSVIGGPILSYLIDFRRLGLVAASFIVSLLIVLAMFIVVDRMTPRIPFKNVDKDPNAVGVFVFGYLVFFGLILHAALSSPI